jgi:hypothetical protein
MKTLSFAALVTLVTLGTAATAAAQETSANATAYKLETAFHQVTLRDVGEVSTAGFMADFGKAITKLGPMQTSVVGEFAIHKFTGDYDPVYVQGAGGLRFGHASSRLRPYAQVMVGVQHSLGSGGMVIQPGAGLNIRTGTMFDARVQVDFPITWWEGERYDQFRLSIGVGIPLGKN